MLDTGGTMKILSLNYEYPPLGGGAGVVSEKLDRLYSARGNRVVAATAGLHDQVGCFGPANRRIIRLNCWRRNRGFSTTWEKIGFIVSGIMEIGWVIRVFKPEIIHCHFAVPTGLLAYYIRKRFKIPYILTSHGGDVPGFTPQETGKYFRLFNWLFKLVWESAASVTTMSRGLADMINESYGIKAVVIPNGINCDSYPDTERVNNRKLQLIYAGRLTAQKNLPHLINCLQSISELQWKLKIVGAGPERDLIKQTIWSNGLKGKIELLDWQDKSQIKTLLLQSDVLCLPSINEGLPMIGLEALAAGLAIIGTATTGIEDIIEEGSNGFLIPPDHPERWSNNIAKLINNPISLAQLKQASRLKSRQYSWEIISNKYIQLLKKNRHRIQPRYSSKSLTLVNLWPGSTMHYTYQLARLLGREYDLNLLLSKNCAIDLINGEAKLDRVGLIVPARYSTWREYLSLVNPLNYIKPIIGVFKKRSRSVIISFFHPFMLGLFLSHKTIYVNHDPKGHYGEGNFLLTRLQKVAMILAEYVVVHSQIYINSGLSHSQRRKYRLMPLPDHDFITTAGNRSIKPRKELLFIGRLVAYKGIEYLIRAFAIVQNEYPDWKLVIKGAGEGYFEDELKKINSSQLVYENRFLSDAELADSIRAARLMVLPYVDGSQSGGIALAAAFKKPVITTVINGIRDQVGDPENVIVVPEKDVVGLAAALRKGLAFSADESSQYGEKLAQHYSQYADKTKIEPVLNEMIGLGKLAN